LLHESRPLSVKRSAIALVAVLATALVPACTDKQQKAVAAPAPVTTTPSATPTPKPTVPAKPKPKPVHPFTGGKNIRKPVAVVKIDNTNQALPQSGLNQADLIYQELVESGITRLLVVYSSRTPTNVGPVRSGRETDIELLGQYGRVTLAYSGAHTGVLRKIRAANLVSGGYDDALSAYHLSRSRRRPYSTYLSVAKLLRAKKGAPAKDVGFQFGTLEAPSRAATWGRLRWSVHVTNTVRYDRKSGRWEVSVNGRKQVHVDNVIVQYVTVQRSRFHDVNGANSPHSKTIGKGKALLLRDGRAVPATWSRKSLGGATKWTGTKGKAMTLRPGTTYIMLVPRGRTLTLR
jgi:hypothetical protein